MTIKIKLVKKFLEDFRCISLVGKILMSVFSMVTVIGFTSLVIVNPLFLMVILPFWYFYEKYG